MSDHEALIREVREKLAASWDSCQAVNQRYAGELTALLRQLLTALEETQRALLASEQYRQRYKLGKYALYEMGGAVQEAAMAHLPCSEGPLESFVRWHVLLPQHRMVVDDLHATADALEAAERRASELEQQIAERIDHMGRMICPMDDSPCMAAHFLDNRKEPTP